MKLPNGYGSVHKLSGNRRKKYRARVTVGWDNNGKQLYEELGTFVSKTEALEVLAEYHKDPYAFKVGKTSFKDVFDLLIVDKQKRKITDKVIDKDKWAFTYCKDIEDMAFCDVKLFNLQKVIDDIPEEQNATRKRVKSVINQMYKFGRANDITTKFYSASISNIGYNTHSDLHQPFTKQEKELLWKNIDTIEYVDILLVYLYTGFRPSELLKIECKTGVNLTDSIPYLVGGSKTEAGMHRKIPIHPKILPIIKKYYNMGNKYLFTNNGKQFNYGTWEYRFTKIMKQLNLEHTPHDPRHTFDTNLDNAGANVATRHRLLGHKDDHPMDNVYLHKDLEEKLKAIELLD